ncbi:MAG: hypothetical protein JJE09_15015 [Bacteroidia bacterium]|nr:hypothetical protein [Bacteroidia bacterium]
MNLRLYVMMALVTYFHVESFAQHLDTAFVQASIQHVRDAYQKSIANQSHLYNGAEYIPYETSLEQQGHPYYLEDDWYEGSIEYNHERYNKVPMRYDIHMQKIVIEYPAGIGEIELINEKINRFTLAGHTFENIRKESNSTIVLGFYDILYQGRTQVLVKRQKIIYKRQVRNNLVLEFLPRDKIYVFKENVYFAISNKASVIKALGDQKQAVKKYISKNKSLFSSNREAALIKIAQLYDELLK